MSDWYGKKGFQNKCSAYRQHQEASIVGSKETEKRVHGYHYGTSGSLEYSLVQPRLDSTHAATFTCTVYCIARLKNKKIKTIARIWRGAKIAL